MRTYSLAEKIFYLKKIEDLPLEKEPVSYTWIKASRNQAFDLYPYSVVYVSLCVFTCVRGKVRGHIVKHRKRKTDKRGIHHLYKDQDCKGSSS